VAEAANTRKVQITVPVADTSVVEWLDLQYSPSESLRRLIRESIAREGFVDVANRPVRPPAQPVYVAESFPDEADDEPAEVAPRAAAPEPEPAPVKTRRSRPAETKPAAAEPPPAQPPADPGAPSIDDLLGL